MRRDIAGLRSSTFDLLVIGGGVYGAALALEAASSGARVALIERGDFASGTSSNSMKILHGGFRYLQHANLRRMRSSIRARHEWSVRFPDLVRPLPCAIESKGWGARSVPAFTVALALNELISAGRNRGVADRAQVPAGHVLSHREFRTIAAPLIGASDTRGCVWWDLLALDTEAMVLGLIAAAENAGACVANYVIATELMTSRGVVHGVVATDVENGSSFEVRAARTILAVGGGAGGLVKGEGGSRERYCWAANVILNRNWDGDTALALTAKAESRQLFFVPWRHRLMIGTHYVERDDEKHTEAEQRSLAVAQLLELANQAAPGVAIDQSDVGFVHWGSLPLHSAWEPRIALQLAETPSLTSYERTAGLKGLWSVTGVKFTTALEVARWALMHLFSGNPRLSVASALPRFKMSAALRDDRSLADAEAAGEEAARHWLARTLEDAVFRRTALGSAGYPGQVALEACARGMARSLGWSAERVTVEVRKTKMLYRERHLWKGNE